MTPPSLRPTIFKYSLDVGDTTLDMPQNAEVLSVQIQYGSITLWAYVVEGLVTEKRKFSVFGTGHHLPDDVETENFVGTVQESSFVWHVFETTEV